MTYNYNDWKPVKIPSDELTNDEIFLLRDSETFCMYPWIHLHTHPTGDTYPCCHAEMKYKLGSTKENTLEEIWFNDNMAHLRENMLNGIRSNVCNRCYEQEEAGFFSGRKSANKHHGHHIKEVYRNKQSQFKLVYWDTRFSNLCNMSCRTCGHIFSSSWYKDQTLLYGDYAKDHEPLNIAGRFETDMVDQLLEHIDYVEHIYFAGGEPLMMKEHYIILDELEKRGKFNTRLVYNTNMSQIKLKDREVFDYWRKFDSVSVGASLDAMGKRAEYIRKGTKWDVIERNREKMLEVCPQVDFYISPTMSVFNVMHIPDFHKNWVEKGFINPQDMNINILQDPAYYRIDIVPEPYKKKIRIKLNEHLEWLSGKDRLNRASHGIISALNFLDGDNSDLLTKFVSKTKQLDDIRHENILDFIPELEEIIYDSEY